jgi:amino acid transporter
MSDLDKPNDDRAYDDARGRHDEVVAADIHLLASLGYGQELLRRMSGFSNFAISMSIICIVSGGITSFPQGFSSVGGAAIGLGWPACCLLSLCVALAMAQVASAFPTAGGVYHWAAILGGRGWGWLAAWFNLAGLITALSAINVGTYQFALRSLASAGGVDVNEMVLGDQTTAQVVGVLVITCAQALLNHLGIRLTAALTDFSGYWILLVASALTAAMLLCAGPIDPARLITFTNYSGPMGGNIWPTTDHVGWLFLLSFLLPAYTVTGFDASANTSEETVGASHHVPRAIVRSVLVSGIFGWIMLSAVVLAIPSMNEAAAAGNDSFHWIVQRVLPHRVWVGLSLGIVVAQFFCGLATVTSASRIAYAFARDGGLPFSHRLRVVNSTYRTPVAAIWTVALLAIGFVVLTQSYAAITGACTIFLYISYVIPTALGLFAYGRTWTRMGPWQMRPAVYRTMAVLSIVCCGLIIAIGIQPPNDQNLWIVSGAALLTATVWIVYERGHFRGPPRGVLEQPIEGAGRPAQPLAAAES